jgi:hypothetical protein
VAIAQKRGIPVYFSIEEIPAATGSRATSVIAA